MVRRLSLIALLILSACTSSIPPIREADERSDDPDLAAAYRAMKQTGSDDPYASLNAARDAMRELPRYSTLDDRMREPANRRHLRTQEEEPGAFGTWQFLGPGNIGGRTRVLVIDPVMPSILYTGGVSGGIWKSTTGGLNWVPVGDDLANIALNALVMDPNDRNILYAGTGEGYFRESVRGTALPLRGDGIFVTRDAGDTWTRITPAGSTDFHYVNDLIVSKHDSSRIYAATRTGIWRSSDSGSTWTRILAPNVNGGCLDLAFRGDTNGDYLFAACGTFQRSTVYRAKNAETNAAWESVLSDPMMGRTSLAIAPSNPSVVYALAATNEEGILNQGLLALFRSQQNGDAGSWQERVRNDSGHLTETQLLSNGITAAGDLCSGSGQQFVTMGWYCNTIAVDPTDPNRVWVGGVDLFRSDNGGGSWGVASYWWTSPDTHTSFVHADQHAIVFHPDYDGSTNRTVYFTNDGGVYRTTDALAQTATGEKALCDPANSKMSFTALNHDYGVTQFYHGAVTPDGKTFLGGTQDNGTLRGNIDDGPNEWQNVLAGDGGYVAIDQEQPRYMYGESQYGFMARSTNGGDGWRRIFSDLRDEEFLFVAPFTMDPRYDTRRLWLGGRSMWRSNDRGENWSRASTPFSALISAVAVHPTNSDIVISGTSAGHIARTTSATTANVSTPWPTVKPRDGFVSSIVFDPTEPSTVYATYAGFGGTHLWISHDTGATWAPHAGNLPDMPVHAIAIDPTRRDRLYLGTDLGIFVSLDRGLTWAVENTGFANAVTEAVFIGQGENGPAVYAFTHGRGAWRAPLVFATKPKRRGVRP